MVHPVMQDGRKVGTAPAEGGEIVEKWERGVSQRIREH
jgi:hypothetical protein